MYKCTDKKSPCHFTPAYHISRENIEKQKSCVGFKIDNVQKTAFCLRTLRIPHAKKSAFKAKNWLTSRPRTDRCFFFFFFLFPFKERSDIKHVCLVCLHVKICLLEFLGRWVEIHCLFSVAVMSTFKRRAAHPGESRRCAGSVLDALGHQEMSPVEGEFMIYILADWQLFLQLLQLPIVNK